MANPWLERRVVAYAHQGGEFEAPSSTLYAIERAIGIGATGIELDVHATKDGELVVCHDPTVDRTTDGNGAIATMTLDDLRRLDNAHWFVPGKAAVHGLPRDDYPFRGRAPADRRYGVATLAEVLEVSGKCALNLDIKQTAPKVAPYEEALAAILTNFERPDLVIVASFHDAATARFRQLAPEIGTSPGQNEVMAFVQSVVRGEDPDPIIARHAAIQVPPRAMGVELVTEAFIACAHELGIAVHVWTIDEPREIRRLCRLGVDAVMSDRPSTLVETLAGLACEWTK
ncbi:MAG: glycerophosphodiester phosphodiesterase [Acidimicrobiales bacterium]